MLFFQPFDPFEIGTAMNERLVTNYAASKLQGAHWFYRRWSEKQYATKKGNYQCRE